MKKFAIIFGLTLVIASLAAVVVFKGKRYEIRITAEQIRTSLDERYPEEKSFLLIFKATYRDPVVEFLPETDRIRVGMTVELDQRIGSEKKRLSGTARLTASVGYDPKKHRVHLVEADIEQLELEGVPKKYAGRITALLGRGAKSFLDNCAVYTLRATDARKAVAKLLLKDVKVDGDELVITLGI